MLLRFLLLSRTCSLVRFAKVIFFFFSRILFLLKFTCQKELRPLRGSEGAFNHSHVRDVLWVGEGYGACWTTAAASLAFDADAVESRHTVFRSDAPHRAYIHTLTAMRAQITVARGLGLEEPRRGVVSLKGCIVFFGVRLAGSING